MTLEEVARQSQTLSGSPDNSVFRKTFNKEISREPGGISRWKSDKCIRRIWHSRRWHDKVGCWADLLIIRFFEKCLKWNISWTRRYFWLKVRMMRQEFMVLEEFARWSWPLSGFSYKFVCRSTFELKYLIIRKSLNMRVLVVRQNGMQELIFNPEIIFNTLFFIPMNIFRIIFFIMS